MTGSTSERTDRSTADGSGDVEVAATAPPSGPRAMVLRGGVPTAEQAAALAAALLSVQAPATSTSPRTGDWQRAALLEGVGGLAVAQRADLERPAQR